MPIRILIADSDQLTVNWLKSILEREGYVVETVASGSDALLKVIRNPPDLLVLETLLSDGDGIEIVRRLHEDPLIQNLHIIILSTRGKPEDVTKGISAGADDYILKRPGADIELVGKIRALLAQPKKGMPDLETARGSILSFISAKGGTGTTSVCVNTAYALARQNPTAEILIVDMVFPMGTVGLSVGFESHKTVVKLTREPDIDPLLIEKYVSARTRWGFRILLGANDPREATELEVSQIMPLFEILRTMYDFVLVDFGRALSRISLPIIELSERIVIILTPDISTVKGTRLIMQYLQSLDISLDRVFVINNRTVGRVWTTTEDIEREIGVKLSATIPYTVEYMTMAINAAVPFMERFPDNSASASFIDVAQRLQTHVKAKAS
jgi:pilus assembly protein CpaE